MSSSRWLPFEVRIGEPGLAPEALLMPGPAYRPHGSRIVVAGTARPEPHVSVVETSSEVLLSVDLPGVPESEIAVELDQNVLTVKARRPPPGEGRELLYTEAAYGEIARRLTLPEGVDAEAISASFDNGVLEVRVPKLARERDARQITVEAAEVRASAASSSARAVVEAIVDEAAKGARMPVSDAAKTALTHVGLADERELIASLETHTRAEHVSAVATVLDAAADSAERSGRASIGREDVAGVLGRVCPFKPWC